MRTGSALIAVILLVAGATVSSADVILSATFDDKTPNQVIGVGGAEEGEPVDVDPYVTAIVRAVPMPTQSLEIQDVHNNYPGAATFQFLDDMEVTQGNLSISMELWFDSLEDYEVAVHESFGSSRIFSKIAFKTNGDVEASDSGGSHAVVGDYSTDRVHRLSYVFDMTNRTYAVFLDGDILVGSGAHGITGRGIGSVKVGLSQDADKSGKLYVDNIEVKRLTSGCIPSGSVMCLGGGRFKVSATYRTPQGPATDAHPVVLTDDTGYFWFFDSENVEVVVKALDGCSFNQRYWVFAAGMTNVEVTLTVEDTALHVTQTYTNPLGHAFEPVQDTNAFATCQ